MVLPEKNKRYGALLYYFSVLKSPETFPLQVTAPAGEGKRRRLSGTVCLPNTTVSTCGTGVWEGSIRRPCRFPRRRCPRRRQNVSAGPAPGWSIERAFHPGSNSHGLFFTKSWMILSSTYFNYAKPFRNPTVASPGQKKPLVENSITSKALSILLNAGRNPPINSVISLC